MVCHIILGGLGTEVVISALRMLALYMRFNGTGICGGETLIYYFESPIMICCNVYEYTFKMIPNTFGHLEWYRPTPVADGLPVQLYNHIKQYREGGY